MKTSTSPSEKIPLPLLSAELLRLTGDAGPGVRRLHELAAGARLPLEKEGRFWVCRRDNLAAVAAALGLIPSSGHTPGAPR